MISLAMFAVVDFTPLLRKKKFLSVRKCRMEIFSICCEQRSQCMRKVERDSPLCIFTVSRKIRSYISAKALYLFDASEVMEMSIPTYLNIDISRH